jgi:hypothetical protein
VNWTKFPVNTNITPNQFNNGHRSQNPCEVAVDISSVAANEDTVYICFQFYSPASMGTNAGCGYSWQIDDVILTDIATYDARPFDPALSGEYTMIPALQKESFELKGKIINYGTQTIGGAKILFRVFDTNNNQIYSDTSISSPAIFPGDTSGFLGASTPGYVLPDTGVYLIDHEIILPTDTETWNDLVTGFIYLNDSIYARDFTAIDGDIQNAFGFNNGNMGYLGQMYRIHHSSAFTSATFYSSDPKFGAQVEIKLYSVAAGVPQNLIATTPTYTITADDTLNPDFITLPFPGPQHVQPGDYFVAVHQMDGNFLSIAAATENFTPTRVFGKSETATTWSSFESLGFRYALMLRLNNPSDSTVKISNQQQHAFLNIYPNPGNDIIFIDANGNEFSNVKLNVINPVGQVVKSFEYHSFKREKIDISNLPAGIYSLSFIGDKINISKNIIIE